MKFGKNILYVSEKSNPEWSPYWIDYKSLKKKIKGIAEAKQSSSSSSLSLSPLKEKLPPSPSTTAEITSDPSIVSSSSLEVDFFRHLRQELKKCCDFFNKCECLYHTSHKRIKESYDFLKKDEAVDIDHETWSLLLGSLFKFYKDVLLLENFAIMNSCAISKILKKHDKMTGFTTRAAFLRNVMSTQSITHHPKTIMILKECEELYQMIKSLNNVPPLQDEERIFVEAMRNLAQSNRKQMDDNNNDSIEFDGINKLLDNDTSITKKRALSLVSSSSSKSSNDALNSISNDNDNNDNNDNNKKNRND